jgi:hypothetical protein
VSKKRLGGAANTPRPGPQKRSATVDTNESSPSGHPSTDHDDTIEAHYASLERGIPCACYSGYHYIGHLVEGEDGEEVEVYEAVPCRRCKPKP